MRAQRPFLVFCWLFVLCISQVPAQGEQKDAIDEVTTKLNFAVSQYEIIAVLLDQEAFETVPEEFAKILSLQLSGTQESAVAEAAWQIADRLRQARHYTLAHGIIDQTLESTEDFGNRFKLLMMRGKIFKDQKLFKQAIETLREAQRLPVPE
jgi:tetratricopeptide (TPR) repeat protein